MNHLPSFRDYDNPDRKNPYGWAWGYYKCKGDDTRQYRTFKTKREKLQFKSDFEQKFYANRDAFVKFDSEKWRKFLEIEQIAGGMNALERAARQAGEFDGVTSLTFEDAAAMKVADLERMKSVNTKRVQLYCARFVAGVGNRILGQYTHTDCQGWIDELAKKHSFNSLKNHHKAIASVFNLAERLGHLSKAPTQHVTFPSGRGEKRTKLFEAQDVQKLLDHIWRQDKPLAGVYAILFFTGLRISMIAPGPDKREKEEYITLKMINARDREIIIPEGIMKKGNALIIDESLAPENLWPWLEHIDGAKIPEPAQTFNKRREKLCAEVGLKWCSNVHRRSCASYFAAINGKSRTADLLGNTEQMIIKHYQVATFRKKADEYFRVLP